MGGVAVSVGGTSSASPRPPDGAAVGTADTAPPAGACGHSHWPVEGSHVAPAGQARAVPAGLQMSWSHARPARPKWQMQVPSRQWPCPEQCDGQASCRHNTVLSGHGPSVPYEERAHGMRTVIFIAVFLGVPSPSLGPTGVQVSTLAVRGRCATHATIKRPPGSLVASALIEMISSSKLHPPT